MSTWYISYPNKITIISKNRTQKLHAIESLVSKIFFVLDPPKSFRQSVWDLKVNYYFPKEMEYTSFKEMIVDFENQYVNLCSWIRRRPL